MVNSEEVLTLKPLDEEEERLAFGIQDLLARLGDLRGNVMLVGVLIALVAVLATVLADITIGWNAFKGILATLGKPEPLLVVMFGFLIPSLAGAILAWVLYGRRKQRVLEAELARVAADPRVSQVFDKLAKIFLVHLKLTPQLRAGEEFFKPRRATAHYVREYFGPLTQKT